MVPAGWFGQAFYAASGERRAGDKPSQKPDNPAREFSSFAADLLSVRR